MKNIDIRDALFDEIYKLMKKDKKVLLLVVDQGAMGLNKIQKDFPKNILLCPVSEQNIINFASGLALAGFKPYIYLIASFMLRSLEQIKINLSISRLNIKLIGSGPGYTYASDGPTHYFTEDFGIFKNLQNINFYSTHDSNSAIKSIKENTDLPAIATMTFDKGPRGYFTMMGIDPHTAAQKLTASGADVVGSNCGNGIDNMLEIARLMRDSTSLPLLIHSNAGIPVIRQGQIVYPETPEYMAKKFAELIEMGGISIFGGCCGTTPKHVEHFSNTIGDFRERQMGEINV